jgi:hypothetical protein
VVLNLFFLTRGTLRSVKFVAAQFKREILEIYRKFFKNPSNFCSQTAKKVVLSSCFQPFLTCGILKSLVFQKTSFLKFLFKLFKEQKIEGFLLENSPRNIVLETLA